MFTHKTNVLWGLSPFALLTGLLYQIISFSCPNWLESDDCYVGLWKSGCRIQGVNSSDPEVLTQALDTMSKWRIATQVLESVAIVCTAVSAISALLRVNHGGKRWQSLCAFSALVTGIFSSVGCIVFAFAEPRPDSFSLSWAFALNLISGCFCILASPAMYLDVRWRNS